MKKEFSLAWKGSSQVRKQRKYLANAPLNVKHKMISANLSKELRKKYGKRNFPVRKGDEVKVLRGKFKGKTGKISVVKTNDRRVAIDGIQNKKKDGTKIFVYFDASKLQITKLNLDDKKRIKAIERKSKAKIVKESKKEIKTTKIKLEKK